MTVSEYLSSGLIVRGNWTRLKRCMRRAEKGETLHIGFLGGSITQGSLASDEKRCYAYRVFDWWQKSFPEANFAYINAGIGGTSSHYGAARADKDLLKYRPDVVVVDFSVNDEANEFFEETFEGVIRKLLKAPGQPAVIIMNNVFYDDGHNAESFHNRIGAYYGVPCVSMKAAVYPMIGAGLYKASELTPDNLHPNDLGHEYVARAITSFLEKVRAQLEDSAENAAENAVENSTENSTESGVKALLPPLTANAYENSRLYQLDSNVFKLDGFAADPAEKKGMLDLYKNGFTASTMNDKIIFEIDCGCMAVQYRKSVVHPVPKAFAVIDGDREHPILLDGNFEEDWGDCLYLQTLIHHAEYKKHTLEITVSETHQEDVRPFYLVSVIAS